MSVLALSLVITLGNQGYWLEDETYPIEIRWAVRGNLPEAVLEWTLATGKVGLANGRVLLPTEDRPSTINVRAPDVRVRSMLSWEYALYRRDDGERLAGGARVIHVYPDNLLQGLTERMAGKTILVCDEPVGLPQLLEKWGVSHLRIAEVSQLATAKADMILIGPDRIAATPFTHGAIGGQAQRGASVMIFRQRQVAQLGGYALQRRARPARLEWRREHPLLSDFAPDDLAAWLAPAGEYVHALLLPADEPVLELAYWPREAPGEEPVPIDALLAVKRVGRGRIVYCQLPLGDWQRDPRAQVFVQNALEYLATRPAPTPPPSQRATTRPARSDEPPTIEISSGVQP
jgi:hypothetical protein